MRSPAFLPLNPPVVTRAKSCAGWLRLFFVSLFFPVRALVRWVAMGWDESHARRLTRTVDRLLHRVELNGLRTSDEFLARMEILRAEKRAAFESRNMERYEAALNAIAAGARRCLTEAKKNRNAKR